MSISLSIIKYNANKHCTLAPVHNKQANVRTETLLLFCFSINKRKKLRILIWPLVRYFTSVLLISTGSTTRSVHSNLTRKTQYLLLQNVWGSPLPRSSSRCVPLGLGGMTWMAHGHWEALWAMETSSSVNIHFVLTYLFYFFIWSFFFVNGTHAAAHFKTTHVSRMYAIRNKLI